MVISIGFITGLLNTSRKHDSIMVMVDRLTKVAHFIPMKSNNSTNKVDWVFIRETVRLHGVPRKIIFEKNSKFT